MEVDQPALYKSTINGFLAKILSEPPQSTWQNHRHMCGEGEGKGEGEDKDKETLHRSGESFPGSFHATNALAVPNKDA